MERKKQNATIGNEIERLFSSKLRNSKSIQDIVKKTYAISGDFLESHPAGSNQKKSDVLILFSKSVPIGVNIKAGKTNFNQITRIWLHDLSKEVGLSREAMDIFKNGIDNHRLKKKKILIEGQFQPFIKEELKSKLNLILELIFKGIANDIAKILALYDRTKKVFYLYDMESVLSEMSKSKISFSSKGVVQIGQHITIQRKGGNGVTVKVPKSHPKHPGNQLQFKMKIISFMRDNQPFTIIS